MKTKSGMRNQQGEKYFSTTLSKTDHVCCCMRVLYRLVLLAGHVSSEDSLYGQGSRLLLPVKFPRHVHLLALLDDDGGLRATHELCQAGDERGPIEDETMM